MRKYDIVRCKINVNFHYVTFFIFICRKRSKGEGSAPGADVCSEVMKEVYCYEINKKL